MKSIIVMTDEVPTIHINKSGISINILNSDESPTIRFDVARCSLLLEHNPKLNAVIIRSDKVEYTISFFGVSEEDVKKFSFDMDAAFTRSMESLLTSRRRTARLLMTYFDRDVID